MSFFKEKMGESIILKGLGEQIRDSGSSGFPSGWSRKFWDNLEPKSDPPKNVGVKGPVKAPAPPAPPAAPSTPGVSPPAPAAAVTPPAVPEKKGSSWFMKRANLQLDPPTVGNPTGVPDRPPTGVPDRPPAPPKPAADPTPQKPSIPLPPGAPSIPKPVNTKSPEALDKALQNVAPPTQSFKNDGSRNINQVQADALGKWLNQDGGDRKISRITGKPIGYDPRINDVPDNYGDAFGRATNHALGDPVQAAQSRWRDTENEAYKQHASATPLKPNGLVDDGIHYGMSGKPQPLKPYTGRVEGFKHPTGMEREITPSVQKQRNDATNFSTLMKDKAEAWNNMDPGMQSRINIGLGGSGATGPSGNYVKGNIGPGGGMVTDVRPAINSSMTGGTAPKKSRLGMPGRR